MNNFRRRGLQLMCLSVSYWLTALQTIVKNTHNTFTIEHVQTVYLCGSHNWVCREPKERYSLFRYTSSTNSPSMNLHSQDAKEAYNDSVILWLSFSTWASHFEHGNSGTKFKISIFFIFSIFPYNIYILLYTYYFITVYLHRNNNNN